MITPVENPTYLPPSWWDTTWENETEPEWRFGAPMPRSLLPCGCHLRRPDYEAILCERHLSELNADAAWIRANVGSPPGT